MQWSLAESVVGCRMERIETTVKLHTFANPRFTFANPHFHVILQLMLGLQELECWDFKISSTDIFSKSCVYEMLWISQLFAGDHLPVIEGPGTSLPEYCSCHCCPLFYTLGIYKLLSQIEHLSSKMVVGMCREELGGGLKAQWYYI